MKIALEYSHPRKVTDFFLLFNENLVKPQNKLQKTSKKSNLVYAAIICPKIAILIKGDVDQD